MNGLRKLLFPTMSMNQLQHWFPPANLRMHIAGICLDAISRLSRLNFKSG